MGFLGLDNERLTIASRFCSGGNDYFFQYLLSKVLNIPNILSLDTDADRINPRFRIFLFLFPRYLKSAMRKGIFKTYLRHDYSDSNIKGPIHVAEQIKRNIPFSGNFAYSNREFSCDNSLTELIRHTIEFIKGKPYGNRRSFKQRTRSCSSGKLP